MCWRNDSIGRHVPSVRDVMRCLFAHGPVCLHHVMALPLPVNSGEIVGVAEEAQTDAKRCGETGRSRKGLQTQISGKVRHVHLFQDVTVIVLLSEGAEMSGGQWIGR